MLVQYAVVLHAVFAVRSVRDHKENAEFQNDSKWSIVSPHAERNTAGPFTRDQ